jgi:SAM-dependent methyltransferase
VLVSPCCKAPLEALKCTACDRAFKAEQGVPVLLVERSSAAAAAAETRYSNGREPWDYGHSAPEVHKYDFIATQCAKVLGPHPLAADIGCSSGFLTERLLSLTDRVVALDLSVTAAARLKSRLKEKVTVAAASALALPFADGALQLAVLSDGLVSWELNEEERARAVAETHRALARGGTAVFMEYLNPRRHHELLDAVSTRFTVGEVSYLADRLWYVTESAFRVLRGTRLYRAFDRSEGWAQALRAVSARFGPKGSKHLCVVVTK